MTFDELDQRLRVFETINDHCVLPGVFIVARIDGRSFTRLTKATHRFDAPFDERFRDLMITTTKHLFNCGFRVIYGYTQSDEISLLLHQHDNTFGRKSRKLNSILASEASAVFSLALGDRACFDCRLCELPHRADVVDYFRWRNEDANRNALNAHCYWLLRRRGQGQSEATTALSGTSIAQKNQLLFDNGINFNDLPAWQKRGVGVYWSVYERSGFNPQTQQAEPAVRRRLRVDTELPMKDAYSSFVEQFVDIATS